MDVVSRTAVWVAAARAMGAREPDPEVRNPDYLAEQLLGDVSRYDVDTPVVDALAGSYEEAMRDPETAGLVRTMMVRSRFIDDALEQAIEAGATQVLILGAGFDSHAYRFEDLLRGTRVFELDRPATLAMKRKRVDQVLGRTPKNLAFIDADLASGDLRATLEGAGYDFAQQSFVIMEGLTMYLNEDALRRVFEILRMHAPGSGIVFDFVTDVMAASISNLDPANVPEAARGPIQRFLRLIRDEPFASGFPAGSERQYIEDLGLQIRDLIMLEGDEAVRRYLTRSDGTEVGEEGMSRRPPVPPEIARAQRETMTYRICEVAIPHKH